MCLEDQVIIWVIVSIGIEMDDTFVVFQLIKQLSESKQIRTNLHCPVYIFVAFN